MTAPIFDRLSAENPGLLCPICGAFELRSLVGADDGGDCDVCVDCWMRNLHHPEQRAERTCVDCGQYCHGFDAMVMVVGDGVIALCRADYERREASHG